jgi:hypothetical protein
MARFGSVDFDERILNAIRDDKLVIFAGAGVSMGSPSNLPSFWKLAKDIASGTGLEPTEPLDRFLGTLNNKGIDVHQRAIEPLSPEGSKPNDLHRNIIRLFRDSKRTRLITTNFDLLFEEAYKELKNDDSFSGEPNIYRAPALPQGYDFNGIVYVHGALPQLSSHRTKDMVLTDADFGRAYLTEGWARRFLVDVFREFTVLFIGYSHNDAIMNYLARALPADRLSGRFALTDDQGNWKLLGIEPIIFKKHTDSSTPYKELYGSIKKLAEVTSRGVLEWNQRIIELSKTSPTDDDALKGEIRHILERDDTTKLFTKHIRGEEWPVWLERQGHLNALFNDHPLNNREDMLAQWLAEHHSNNHPNTLLKLALKHNLEINPKLWEQFGRHIKENRILEKNLFERLADIIIISKPTRKHHKIHNYEYVFRWIAEKAHEHKSPLTILKAFMAINEYDVTSKHYSIRDNTNNHILTDHRIHSMNPRHMYENYIKPNLEFIATPLLTSIIDRLEDISSSHEIWNPGSLPFGWDRMAIEDLDGRHDDETSIPGIDVMIDAARDALEFLKTNETNQLDSWANVLIKSKHQILQRLAIHASILNPNRTPEEKLNWIMNNIDLGAIPMNHEIYRAVAISYKYCRNKVRQNFVQRIFESTASSVSISKKYSENTRTEIIFRWLTWLSKSKPDCNIATAKLEIIKVEHPHLRAPSNFEFPFWSSGLEAIPTLPSPLSVQELLNNPPHSNIELLLSHGSTGEMANFDRYHLLENITKACTQSPEWALNLIKELAQANEWGSDLWKRAFQGLKAVSLTKDQCLLVLDTLKDEGLLKNQDDLVADLLLNISRDKNSNFFKLGLSDRAHDLSCELWNCISTENTPSVSENWLGMSIYSSVGIVVNFWMMELFHHTESTSNEPRSIPKKYKDLFEHILENSSKMGNLGRPMLFKDTRLLFWLDKPWTKYWMLPLLKSSPLNKPHLFEQAWDGLLEGGCLPPPLSGELLEDAMNALITFKEKIRRERLIRAITRTLAEINTNPNDKQIPFLFNHLSLDEVEHFYNELQKYISHSKENQIAKIMWKNWLHQFIENRIQNIPTKLEEQEVTHMIDLIAHLSSEIQDAMLLIAKFPEVKTFGYHMICRNLRKSKLLETHSDKAAQLLIHIFKCTDSPEYMKDDFKDAIDNLLNKVNSKLKKELKEVQILLP